MRTTPITVASLLLFVGVLAAAEGLQSLTLQRRLADDKGAFHIRQNLATWDLSKTAAIVCDMWDQHWCQGATRRVGELAGPMNEFLTAARAKGVFIIHAPSDTMGAYADTPARKRAQAAPKATDSPARIGDWAGNMPGEKGAAWPLDQSDGGCDCQPTCKQGSPWRKQIAAIQIRDEDAVTDSGQEVWNLLAQRGIENVLVMGVHTNMCVIGRPFGLRNLVRCGKKVVLVRDLTDTMYNSRKAPFVSHFRGSTSSGTSARRSSLATCSAGARCGSARTPARGWCSPFPSRSTARPRRCRTSPNASWRTAAACGPN